MSILRLVKLWLGFLTGDDLTGEGKFSHSPGMKPSLILFALLTAATFSPAQSPVPAAAAARKLADGFKFTEGPSVGPDGRIYFSDIPNARIMVYDPKTAQTTVHRENSGGANGLVWTSDGDLIACEGKSRRVSRQHGTQITAVAELVEGKKLNAPNDLALDGKGGLYFSDPAYGLKPDELEQGVEGVYHVALADGTITRVVGDLVRPNGLVFSPDRRILYIADAGAGKIWAYDVTGPGKLENKRAFADAGSDGMTVDTQGRVYLTWKGEIWIFSAEGKELGRIACPEAPANCLLTGKTLYITARTGFYSIVLDAEGVQ